MNKKIIIPIIGGITILIGLLVLLTLHKNTKETSINQLEATILSSSDETVMIQDKDNIIYTFENNNLKECKTENIILEYTGILNKNNNIQNASIINCNTITTLNETEIPTTWQDNGIFSKFYTLAYNQVKNMTLEEKIAQILLVRYPSTNGVNILKQYQFAGYIFFERDFTNKTKEEVIKMIKDLQEVASIPILTAVDEEGGTVVRISSNPNLASDRFLSPSALYQSGGFPKIKEDTIAKSTLLESLGINLNLAPVVDVSTDPSSYMYERTLKENTTLTSTYAKTVIEASKNTKVSYTLKHFPGYGNNTDTHNSSSTDTRTYNDILSNDLPPFKEGINAGAEAVLVSHNIVNSIDSNNEASLSPNIHNLLRNQLNFTGIIMTDDISMSAVNTIPNTAVKAILAGNDLIITTNYQEDITNIKNAINNGTLNESTIEKLAMRVIAWKYYKGLLFENQK